MPRHLPVVMSVVAVTLVAVATISRLRQPTTPVSLPPTSDAAAVAGTSPGADNVSHAFRVEVAALTARLDSAPRDTLALARLGTLLQTAHQPAQALPYLVRYVALRPDQREAWLQLAACYGALSEWDQALATTTAMLARWPNDPEAMYNAGAIHANLGDTREAQRWWERVRDQQDNPALAGQATASLQRLPAQVDR